MAAAEGRATDWLRDLADTSVRRQVEALRTYEETIEKLTSSETTRRLAPDAYLGAVRELAGLSVRYYENLLRLGHEFQQQLLDSVERGTRRPAGEASTAADGTERVEVTLHAPAGETATASLVLENKRDESAEIGFSVSDFSTAGVEAFAAPLTITPDHFTLAPREERVVSLSLPIDADRFTAGTLFHATVVVHGYDDLELAVSAWADR